MNLGTEKVFPAIKLYFEFRNRESLECWIIFYEDMNLTWK